ncbi:ribosomal RNA small subunit methyltransferase G [Geobacter sp. OR-1]|uniref:16S rRNA (guanine(527)-N(7))-methyltransferase RsmG n=1 Tax=Geobacter sp. OR-1 TaxID=1266765 RepID=UPI000541FB63|nr:16S rRNA (guanine(527)-N(7))-methyltransferase RsmG [Geobacter sp. OR-1]GAM08503.1 ribosomal RNA small subunit methyltransferase G [Geobacter sp. OR-1]
MSPAEMELLRDGAKELGIELSDSELDRFRLFTDELLRWNAKLNLTALTDPRDIIVKHYLDSLTINSSLPLGASLLDFGSGAGFPCLPLKIVRHDLDLLSVDSVQKKINFQRQVSRLLGLERFKALHTRVEALAKEGGRFDFVVARAVADVAVLARLGAPFLAENGRLIAMKGSRWREEIVEAGRELDELGLAVIETRELRLPITGDERGIVIIGRK